MRPSLPTVVSVNYHYKNPTQCVVCYKADIILISLKINLFSPWYSWKIVEVALYNNHVFTRSVSFFSVFFFFSFVVCLLFFLFFCSFGFFFHSFFFLFYPFLSIFFCIAIKPVVCGISIWISIDLFFSFCHVTYIWNTRIFKASNVFLIFTRLN